MTWKEILEVTATVLTIAVSCIAIFGAFIAHRKGFLKAMHHLAMHHSQNIEKHKNKQD